MSEASLSFHPRANSNEPTAIVSCECVRLIALLLEHKKKLGEFRDLISPYSRREHVGLSRSLRWKGWQTRITPGHMRGQIFVALVPCSVRKGLSFRELPGLEPRHFIRQRGNKAVDLLYGCVDIRRYSNRTKGGITPDIAHALD